MYVASYLLPKDIRLVSALGWYHLFVGCGLTRRVSRRVRADRSLSPTGEPEQGVKELAIFTSLSFFDLTILFESSYKKHQYPVLF